MSVIDTKAVAEFLAKHTDLYRKRLPVYQTVMLNDLGSVWLDRHRRVLDIGGGTGVIAQAIQEFLPAGKVSSVDVVDRYFGTLTIESQVYDGQKLPFGDDSFDAATINNVMHHIPRDIRPAIMKEIRRVVTGPIYIKDHLATSWLDHKKLVVLDAIGNIPFGGQIEAWYLSQKEWEVLARGAGYSIVDSKSGKYRGGFMEMIFPNRLETTMRLQPE